MAKLGRRERSLLILALLGVAALGWALGGEQPVRTISQDVAVPDSVQ